MTLLIVGLGNPGEKYIGTRHNIGFKVVDKLREELKLPDFKMNKKFNTLMSRKGNLMLIKPQTYMNKSGNSVSRCARYYNLDPQKIVVIHDDSDFGVGKVKIDKNRSSGGHNGVQSIIDHLSSKNFWRIRFGVGKEGKRAGEIALQKFSKSEKEIVEKMIEELMNELKNSIKEGFAKKSIKKTELF